MGKIDDNDDQIEEVAKILKQLTHSDDNEKKDEQKEEVLEFTELFSGKSQSVHDMADDENVDDYGPLHEEIHLDDEKPAVTESFTGEMSGVKDLSEEEDLSQAEELSEEALPKQAETGGANMAPKNETVVPPVKKKAVKKTSANAPSRKMQEHVAEEPAPAKMTTGKLMGTLVRKFFFSASLGVFAFALTGLLVLLWGYYVSEREYDQINDEYVVIGTGTAPENSDGDADVVIDVSTDEADTDTIPFLDITVDERKLKALNEDYAFYIVIPGTNIQYPVVQGDDNNHYLRYTYSNQENTAGSIQVDYRTDRDTYLETFNTILHGHNRQDGTMFSDLANYIDESYRDENPYIYIIMDDKEYVYEIFAFYDMIPVAVCYNPNTDDTTYLSFIEENNTYSCDIDVTVEDHIISLYTCNDDSSMRYLVHAVLREIYDLS